MTINKLVGSYKRVKIGGDDLYQDGKSLELIVITCLQFHKKGHFRYNFPLENKSGASSENKKNQQPMDLNLIMPRGTRYP